MIEKRTRQCCSRPFETMEIHPDGSVYFCCPAWNNYYKIGNIFSQSLDEVWNSKEAIELRKRVLNNDYSLCDKDCCVDLKNRHFFSRYGIPKREIMDIYPAKINFCYDYECNQACIICRDNIKVLSDEDLEKFNSIIDSFLIPILKNTKVLAINANGEPFASRHSRLLIKKAIEVYPNLKFEFLTNGFLCNERTFNELGITPEKIEEVHISLHAANKKTYANIVKDGEKRFDTIIKNIKWLNKIKKEHKCNFYIGLSFVLTSKNYKDLPSFIKFAEKYADFPQIWEYRYQQNTSIKIDNKDIIVTDKNHKEYKKLRRILNNHIVKKQQFNLSPLLVQIMKEYDQLPLIEKIKELFE